jgi:hypothetical protein
MKNTLLKKSGYGVISAAMRASDTNQYSLYG